MKSRKEQVYQDIRYRIITHDIAPGQLLNEKELMTHYAIGRTPLRDLMIELQKDGLIQRFPRSGTIVTPMDLHLFKEVIAVRIELEGFAGTLIAEKATESELEALQDILRKVEETEEAEHSLDTLTKCEFDFHNLLYTATHNQKLQHILHELHGISARFWHYWVFSRQEVTDQFNDHRHIMNALLNRDPKGARVAMQRHIQNFVNKVRDKIL